MLFANNTIVLDHEEEEYPGEKAKLEEEKEAALETNVEPGIANDPVKKAAQPPMNEEIRDIRTADEVINYVNNRFDKECKTLATAMKHASKAGLIFPDFNE